MIHVIKRMILLTDVMKAIINELFLKKIMKKKLKNQVFFFHKFFFETVH